MSAAVTAQQMNEQALKALVGSGHPGSPQEASGNGLKSAAFLRGQAPRGSG